MVSVTLHNGDCLEYMRTLADGSVDAVISDPPAGIAFMGKQWDHDKGGRAAWVAWMTEVMAECLRVLKPGGHALVWAIPRTAHWTATALEDAGFEIRDKVYHIFGSGFPKSLDVSKAIDKAAQVTCPQCNGTGKHVFTETFEEWIAKTAAHGGTRKEWEKLTRSDTCGRCAGLGFVRGAEREVIGRNPYYCEGRTADPGEFRQGGKNGSEHITAPATSEAKQWQGWGTALKPAAEEWILARKPLTGTVAANVLEWGTGAINVDGCRVGTEQTVTHGKRNGTGNSLEWSKTVSPASWQGGVNHGRWPANVTHDGSDEVVGLFPVTTSGSRKAGNRTNGVHPYGFKGGVECGGDIGSAARFFYCAKASKADRDEGLEGMPERPANSAYGDGLNSATKIRTSEQAINGVSRDLRRNHHPTVKPTSLMRWLCRLITPPGGVILDPFMGSGSTGKAAKIEGFSFIGCDLDADYVEIARRRIDAAQPETEQPTLFEAAD